VRTAVEETDDPDVRFKLRTALQLLDVVRDRHERVAGTLAEADPDEELQNRLREMGYLD
jgi:hypothetical protein